MRVCACARPCQRQQHATDALLLLLKAQRAAGQGRGPCSHHGMAWGELLNLNPSCCAVIAAHHLHFAAPTSLDRPRAGRPSALRGT